MFLNRLEKKKTAQTEYEWRSEKEKNSGRAF